MKKLLSTRDSKQLLSCLLLFLFIFSSAKMLAQKTEDFNLPPGAKFMIKKFEYINYDYKLNMSMGQEPIDKNWLFKFSDQELAQLQTKNFKQYNYYIKAKTYFDNLSDRVKSIYKLEELWYIYMYDKKLKDRLPNIK